MRLKVLPPIVFCFSFYFPPSVFSRQDRGARAPLSLSVRKTNRAVRGYTQHSTSKQQHNLSFSLAKDDKTGYNNRRCRVSLLCGRVSARAGPWVLPAPKGCHYFVFLTHILPHILPDGKDFMTFPAETGKIIKSVCFSAARFRAALLLFQSRRQPTGTIYTPSERR